MIRVLRDRSANLNAVTFDGVVKVRLFGLNDFLKNAVNPSSFEVVEASLHEQTAVTIS